MRETTAHTAEYMLQEAKAELVDTHHRNADLCQQLRVIKRTRWYRFGKFLRLIP